MKKLSTENKALFEKAVTHIFDCWTALQLAVYHEWGGRNSAKKKEKMLDDVKIFFENGVVKSQEKLENYFWNIFIEDFNCNIEDNSDLEVAEKIWNLYQSLAENDLTAYNAIISESSIDPQRSREQTVGHLNEEDSQSDIDLNENC